MAELSGEEKHQVEAGARAFVQELQKASPGILIQGVAALGNPEPDPAFLQHYTENLGQLATAKFSDAFQSLLEEEDDEDTGFLQSADGGSSIGFFVLGAFRKHLCNPIAEADLKAKIAKVRKEQGLDINPTAASISTGAATGVALTVATLIGGGTLAVVLAPLAGSVALLLLLVGVDAFCGWAASKDH
jgi:hypothetical protein